MIAKYYSRWKFVLLNLLGLITSTRNIVMAYVLGMMTNALAERNIHALPQIFMITFCLFFIVLLAELGYNYLKNDAVQEVNTLLRTKILAGMLQDTTEKNASTLGFLTNDFKLLETNRFGAEISIVFNAATIVISLAYAVYINWLLTIFFLLGATIPVLFSTLFQKEIRFASTKWTKANSAYVNQTKNILAGTDSLKLYKQSQVAVKKNQRKVTQLESALRKMNLLSDNTQTLANFIGMFSTFIIPAFLGGLMVLHGQTTIGTLFAVVQLANSFINPTMQVLNDRNHLSATKNIVLKVKQYVRQADAVQAQPVTDFKQEVAFIKINLERDQHNLAQGINLQVKKGQKIALIGPSGSGKSTLLQFMMYGDFGSADKITVDGQECARGTITDLFAYASQAPIIFADDLWFNLTLGANIPKVRVKEICAALQLEDLIAEKGFDYQLGNNADQLSGGQLARIELARALLSQRPILLLDEINASLDKKTAAAIHQYLLASELTFVEVIHHYDQGELAQYDQVIDFADYLPEEGKND
ncbi:ABC transporter ATP-binding protein [Lactobacillus sp. ESL0791]|uniref:ATP-binding cassette domain-containing protein n=1 Tax=Lactobacillus sp. ESL0791 TaxID=2983234 RepID=UPI0023FA1A52|nr:ABC transporter ATP-binding protein [Lactobacillus sp. ESL0791]MDF7639635.1 ABC transporter ATP-binding protein [Lactobacillus sp. ESL0791]